MKNRSFLIRSIISLIFIGVIVGVVRQQDFLGRLQQVQMKWLLASLALSAVMVSGSTLKWQVLLRQQGFKVSFAYLIRTYLVGYYFSNLLPSNFGGDVVRSWYAGKKTGSQGRAAVSVFMERFTGLILLLIMVMGMPLLTPGLMKSPYFFIPAVVAGVFLVAALMVWCMDSPSRLPRAVMGGVLRGFAPLRKLGPIAKLFALVEKFSESIFAKMDSFHLKLTDAGADIRKEPKWFVPVGGLTVFFYALTLVNVYVAFRAFGVEPNFILMASVVPTVMMVGMFPVGILGNAGFTELSFMAYFSLIGFSTDEALAMSLLLRFKMLLLGVLGLPFYLTDKTEVDQFKEEIKHHD